jgi:hypothetical protein
MKAGRGPEFVCRKIVRVAQMFETKNMKFGKGFSRSERTLRRYSAALERFTE